MKKIVQIVSGYRAQDGIGNVAVARVRALLNLGCQVTVICHETEPAMYDPPAPAILVTPFEAGHHQSVLPAAVRQAVIDADVVILDVGGHSPLITLAEIKTGRLIVDYHGMTPPGLIRDPGYTHACYRGVRMLRDLRPFFDALVTHSRFIQDEWLQTVGPMTAPCEVVPLFGSLTPLAAAKSVAVGNRSLRLLTVGRMFPHKNYEVAIRAVERLRSRKIDVQLQHLGGGGDVVSQAYRAQLEALIAGLGLNDRVQLRGAVSQAGLEKAYQESDAVVLPSLHEGFALPAVEAMACGKPVFASELGALPETLDGAGVLFNPFDADELADKITAYFERPEAARQVLAEAALKRARELSQEVFGKRYVELVMRPAATAVSIVPKWNAQDAAEATLTVKLAEGFTERLPFLEGVATVGGLKRALPEAVQLTVHVVDAGGRVLQYDERPVQTRKGTVEAPVIDFRLLLARSERPHRVIFQLAAPSSAGGLSPSAARRVDLFGRPQVVTLPARTGEPLAIEQAQQILQMMQQLAELNFEVKYPTDTLGQKFKAFVARNVTARLQTRYIQPHVELQGEINRNFVELLGLILKENDERGR